MSQASTQVPTSGMVSGLAMAQAINAAMDAIASDFTGATDPAQQASNNIQPNQTWADTGNMLLNRRSADNSQWIVVGVLDSVYQGMLARSGGNMSGAINEALGTAVASSAAPDIWSGAGAGNNSGASLHITGTTAITGFAAAPQAGACRRIIFDGALTLTNGANLILPTGANIQTVAGDCCVVLAETTTKFRVISYTRADGTPLASGATSQIRSAAASVASNALTLTINPDTFTFHNAALTSGALSSVALTAAASLTVPSGATLGTTNGVAARIALLAINNAGVIEPAVVNITSASINLDECGLISTTAIGSSANSAGIVYSAAARTNVPYRVVALVDTSQTTAGTWAVAPFGVYGVGGIAGAALGTLGVGQSMQDVHTIRSLGATYYNTTGKPFGIYVSVSATGGGTCVIYATLDGGTSVVIGFAYSSSSYTNCMGYVVIPPYTSYKITASIGVIAYIYEQR